MIKFFLVRFGWVICAGAFVLSVLVLSLLPLALIYFLSKLL